MTPDEPNPNNDSPEVSNRVSVDEIQSFAGYLYTVSTGESESTTYPGTRLDEIDLYTTSTGETFDTSTAATNAASESTDIFHVQLSVNQHRLAVTATPYDTDDTDSGIERRERTVYPGTHAPDEALPHERISKADYIAWVEHVVQNPMDLGTEVDLKILESIFGHDSETLTTYLTDVITSCIITPDSRKAYSITSIADIIGVSEDAIEPIVTDADADIVEITISPPDKFQDEPQRPGVPSGPHYGHSDVFDDGEELEWNVKPLTDQDRETLDRVETIVVDVDDLFNAFLSWVYEIPMGVDRYPYLVISPPPETTQITSYIEQRKDAILKNGVIEIHPTTFFNLDVTPVTIDDLTEAFIEAGTIDHPEDHETYYEFITTTELKDEITISQSEYETRVAVTYTGLDDTEYQLPTGTESDDR